MQLVFWSLERALLLGFRVRVRFERGNEVEFIVCTLGLICSFRYLAFEDVGLLLEIVEIWDGYNIIVYGLLCGV